MSDDKLEQRARRYCWRAGAALELAEGEVCPECGSDNHQPVPAGQCGSFAKCGDHGHPCMLEPGHDGACSTEPCGDK